MRILIATVTAGAGHLQAAAALEEAWRALRPDDVVEKVDLLNYVPRLQRKAYANGYTRFVEHAPELWGLLFRKTDNASLLRKLTRFRRLFARQTNRRFVRFLLSFRPDAVLSTHFLPVEVLGHVKSKSTDHAPFSVCVITDFEAHALWMEPSVDRYCVAAKETKASLVARGVPPERILVTGIPIAKKFSASLQPKTIRKACGLRDDLRIVLVLGGGFGMGPVGEILTSLEQVQTPMQTVVVTGRNEKLRQELACRTYRHPTKVLGFVTNMHELMAIADLIVTKPGGLTTSEAMALGKPLVILNPIPGQETANSDFLLEHGAAGKVNRVDDLPYKVEQLLGSKQLAAMAKSAKALGKPSAAEEICQEAIRCLAAP